MLARVASEVSSYSNGYSTQFIYDSAKDVLKWNKLEPRHYIKDIMDIGRLLSLSDEEFSRVSLKSKIAKITQADIADTLKKHKERKNGGDQNKS